MKRILLHMGVLALMMPVLIGTVQADQYYLADNWKYTYGSGVTAATWLSSGSTGAFSSVSQFDSAINNPSEDLVGYYFLTGTGAGTGSGLNLTNLKLTIYDTTGSTIVWTGAANSSILALSQNIPQTNFQQAPYNTPFGAYSLAGGIQDGIGSPIVFDKTSGSLGDYAIDLDWVGLTVESKLSNGREGNLGGEITTLPEPASILLGLIGLGSLAVFCRFRKRTA
jgi:hypothetical protein